MAIVFQLERNGALFGVHGVVAQKVLDTADIVREAIFQQLAEWNVRYNPSDFTTILVRRGFRTSEDGVDETLRG